MSLLASKGIDGPHILRTVFGKLLRSLHFSFTVYITPIIPSGMGSITFLLLQICPQGFWGVLQDTWLTLYLDESSILKPGGWLQLIEIYHMIQSDNGTITEDNVLRQMSTNLFSAIEGTKDPRAPLRFDSMMREAGLVELGSRMIPLPLNGWPSG